MEALLRTSGWRPIRSNSAFETLQQQVVQYNGVKDNPAWLDFQYRLAQLREATRLAVERGGVDRNGERHDDEQRKVLFVLDTLLGYVPALREQLAIIEANKPKPESEKGPIHGEDLLGSFVSLTSRR